MNYSSSQVFFLWCSGNDFNVQQRVCVSNGGEENVLICVTVSLTCPGVASHVAQRPQRSQHRVPVLEVIQTELNSRLVAVMNHG